MASMEELEIKKIKEDNERLRVECNCLAEQTRELINKLESLELTRKKDIEVIYKLASKLADC